MTASLDDLTLPVIKSLWPEVAKAMASFEGFRKNEARAVLEAAAKSSRFTFAELTRLSVDKQRAAVAPKYTRCDKFTQRCVKNPRNHSGVLAQER